MSGITRKQLVDMLQTSEESCPGFASMFLGGLVGFDKQMGGDGECFKEIAKEINERKQENEVFCNTNKESA